MTSSLQFHRATATATARTGAATTAVSTCHKHLQPAVRRVCLTRGVQTPDHVARVHTLLVGPFQCCSVLVQNIHAPLATVWSILSQFDNPQTYKHFIKSCRVVLGDSSDVGSIREVQVISGLPASYSTERLEMLDEERYIISFRVVGGDHRLKNYRSVTSLHESTDREGTVVIESYVVDVPPGNTKEETCSFADTIVRCNLQSLAQLAENMARNQLKVAA